MDMKLGHDNQPNHQPFKWMKIHHHAIPVWLSFLRRRYFEKWLSFVRTMEVSGNQNCLVNSILQNIVFCVPIKKFTPKYRILGWTITLGLTNDKCMRSDYLFAQWHNQEANFSVEFNNQDFCARLCISQSFSFMKYRLVFFDSRISRN